jgi:hypothetical protein
MTVDRATLLAGFARNPGRKYTVSELVKALKLPDNVETRHDLVFWLGKLEEEGKIVDGHRGEPPFRLVEFGLAP